MQERPHKNDYYVEEYWRVAEQWFEKAEKVVAETDVQTVLADKVLVDRKQLSEFQEHLTKMEVNAGGMRSAYEGKGEPKDIGYYDGKADAYHEVLFLLKKELFGSGAEQK